MTLFEVPPPQPAGPEPAAAPAKCRKCRRPIRDPVSLGYQIGPDCRHQLGIDPPKRPPRFGSRRSGPVEGQQDLLTFKINEGKTMAFIDEEDSPVLLKARVNGKDGFLVLPQGQDEDGLYFTSVEALRGWVSGLRQVTAYPQDAQPYEEWLEMYGGSAGDEGEGQ